MNRPIHAEFEAWSLCLDVQRYLHLQLFSLQRGLPAGQNQLQRYLSGNYGIGTTQLPVIQIHGSCQEYRRYLRPCSRIEFQTAAGNWLETQEAVIWQDIPVSCMVKRSKVAVKWRYLSYLSIREILAAPGRDSYPKVTSEPRDPRMLSGIGFPGSCQVYGPS